MQSVYRVMRIRALPRVKGWLWYVVLAFAVLIVVWKGRDWWGECYNPDRPPRDFFQEWASAKNVRTGLPVYTPHARTIPLYLGRTARLGAYFVEINAHPPVSVLLALPFAGFDYSWAHFLWNLLGLVALAAGVVLIARTFDLGSSPWGLLGLVLLLASGPVQQGMAQGQLSMVLSFLIVAGWWADRGGRSGWAGALVGLATAIKCMPAVLFWYFAVRRRWSALLAGAASFSIACLISAAVLGPKSFPSYVEHASPQIVAWRSHFPNSSLAGFWHKLFDPGVKGHPVEPIFCSPDLARALTFSSGLALLALTALAVRRAGTNGQTDLAFALTVTASLLVSIVTWDHYFIMLLLPLVVMWRRLPALRPAWWALLGITCVLWQPYWRFFLCAEKLFGTENVRIISPIQVLTLFSLQFYALLGLFGLLFLEVRRASQDTDAWPNALKSRDRQGALSPTP